MSKAEAILIEMSNQHKEKESNPIPEGWQRKGKEQYIGLYRANSRMFWGAVNTAYKNTYRFYIWNPPNELRNHPKFSSFRYIGQGWYLVHFIRSPKSLKRGIQMIEDILVQAFKIDEKSIGIREDHINGHSNK